MEKKIEKKTYVKPELGVIEVELEQGIAAGSGSNGPVQPGGGSGVEESGWIDGGTDTQEPTGEWWK